MSDRWFRRLLRLLPEDVRADYGSEMTRVFREQRKDAAAAGPQGHVRLWIHAIAGVLAVGPREHLEQLWQDARYALRAIRRNPAFAAVAIVTLALGIGANAAIFSVVQAVLLRPLPYHEPDRLMAVWNRWDGTAAAGLSDPEYLDYAERSRTLVMAAAAGGAANVGGMGGDPERVATALITANALDVLGVAPALGRGFRAEDARPNAPPVAIVSHGFWQRRFGGDPSIVGRSISVNAAASQIVGVMPPHVPMPTELASVNPVELYVPLTMDPGAPRNRRGGHYLRAFARLSPGATPASASAEMDTVIAGLIRTYPDEHDQGNFGIVLRPLREDLLGDVRPVLLILAGAAALVLLVACTNVANLMLARGTARERELAVRTALGASRFRLMRQVLTESWLLAILGAAAGLLVAFWAQRPVLAFGMTALPRLDQLAIDSTVLAFSGALALGSGLLLGLVPALQGSRAPNDLLQDGSRGSTAGRRAALRRALVVCQVGVAVLLLCAAGLLIKSYARLTSVPAGLDPAAVLTMRITLPQARYPGRPDINVYFSRLVEEVQRLPGVRMAGAGSGLPLALASGDWSFDIEGRPRNGTRFPGAADWYVVTAGYFEALGVPLVRGRLPRASDDWEAAPVVFINEATARALFADEDPVGRRIRLSQSSGAEQPWRTIAGIVGDVRFRGLDTAPRPEMFIPHEQFVHFSATAQARAMTLVVKAGGDPMLLVPSIRGVMSGLDPEVPPAQIRDMESVMTRSVADRRLNVLLIGAFGVLALVLAAVGLYGLVAYSVAQRTRELGVRLALGASRTSVLRLVVSEGARLVLVGSALGVAAALALSAPLSTLLFDVHPRDVAVLATAPALLLLVGMAASYIPARRATRVDPVVALRAE